MTSLNKDPMAGWRGACVPFFVFVLLSGRLIGLANSRDAQSWHKLEFAAALSGNFSFLDTTYHHDYSPQVYNYKVTELDSLVNQQVNIKGKNALGTELKVNLFLTKKIGVQFLADFHNTRLAGTDNFQHVHLRFSFKPYPTFEPVIVYRDELFLMRDTDGQVKQKTFSLNLLARFPLARRINLDFSGGTSLILYSGKAQPIGYIYHGFAHDIFVSIPYSFEFSIPATTALGANIGGEFNITLGPHLLLYAAGRYVLCFAASTEPQLIADLSRTYDQDQESLRITQQRLNLQPLKMKLSFFSLKIGLGLGF